MYSQTSKPMPPLPTIATRLPTVAFSVNTSWYETTLGWSAPGMSNSRGVTPVARTTAS